MQIDEKNITIENLHVQYGKVTAVNNFNLSIKNETVVLFGPSGCGKTTILKSILGISETGKKQNGKILYNDEILNNSNGDIGMTFQGPVLPNWLQVFDLCNLGSNIRKIAPKDKENKVLETLNTFGVAHLGHKFPSELSGGEKQRVALAVTLLNNPKVLLLDEPTTFIDGGTKLKIWNYIENYIRSLKLPTVIVSHDPIESILLGDKIIVLRKEAHIAKIIKVDIVHPRDESLLKEDEFWAYKQNLENYV